VTVRLEALGLGELIDGLGHTSLERGGRSYVDDLSAVDTEEVMVVLGEVLGELEAGELVVGRDSADQPHDLKVDKMAVGGAAG
jgi:hypothetical protein